MNKATLFFLFIFVQTLCFSQDVFFGKVVQENGLTIEKVDIYNDKNERITQTNEIGLFQLTAKKGEKFKCFHENYSVLKFEVGNSSQLNPVVFTLIPLEVNLDEVVLTNTETRSFTTRKLRDVESNVIFAGKKNEVILLQNIPGNLGLNLSRQIYSQVSGLNIYESSVGALQLSIGGRGLDPNRTSNFNTRQNGYDISADVLGYPESYYTPPALAIEEIQILRGASSLRFGSQFGGLINFKLKSIPKNKKWSAKTYLTYGSYDFKDSFTLVGFNSSKVNFTSYYNFKNGNGYRDFSQFQSHNLYSKLEVQLTDKSSLTAEYTFYHYLAQQAGGLTDIQFSQNPRLSTRNRNWFFVNWNVYNMEYKLALSSKTDFSFKVYGLQAKRNSVGYRGNPLNFNENPILSLDEQDAGGNYIQPRDLILGNFNNYGIETTLLNRFDVFNKKSVFLIGAKWYDAYNRTIQGPGSNGTNADFSLFTSTYPDYPNQSDFAFPNKNLALFIEHLVYLNSKWSVTPGVRFENINTASQGDYQSIVFDNAGNPLANQTLDDNRELIRSFLLLGLGVEFNPKPQQQWFINLSQNYRSVTFSDIRVVNPTFVIDPNIQDEKGYTFDAGVKGASNFLSYNLNVFSLLYNNRIGVILNDRAQRLRTNIGNAFIYGIESLVEVNLLDKNSNRPNQMHFSGFVNFAYTEANYRNSLSNNIKGNRVEFVPRFNLKGGLKFKAHKWETSLLISYLSSQFTDAQNSIAPSEETSSSGVIGEIPSYSVVDFSASYSLSSRVEVNFGVNNLLNKAYFTQRATGYPGPGIIPSDNRNWFIGLVADIGK